MRKIFQITIFSVLLLSCEKKEVSKENHKNLEEFSVKDSSKKEIYHQVEVSQSKSYKKYSGAWFDVEYPVNFTAKASLKSITSAEGSENATFTSPDKKFQFYIFSPQWLADAKDIILQPNEKLENSTEEKSGIDVIKRWTISAKDGSYKRSYEQTKNESSMKIFGIKYSSKEDLDTYREQYLHFKKSLIQYGD